MRCKLAFFDILRGAPTMVCMSYAKRLDEIPLPALGSVRDLAATWASMRRLCAEADAEVDHLKALVKISTEAADSAASVSNIIDSSAGFKGIAGLNLEKLERAAIVAALELGGTRVEAAEILGVQRHTLRRRIKKHGISICKT